MPDKPTFRRGIKLGRIRKVKVPIIIYKKPRKGTPKDAPSIPIGTRNKVIGHEDGKTHKRLKPDEVSRFREYKTAQLLKNLAKLPENSPGRQRKNPEGILVDRITGKPANRAQVLKAREEALQPSGHGTLSPLLPEKYRKAARTATRDHGTDFEDNLGAISDWWVSYSSGQTSEPFPRQEIGSP